MAREPEPPQPTLLLVTGLPGTGKSTVADQAAALLGAPVLAHDWAMSGIRPFRAVQDALESMVPSGHQPVGWSILYALARSQIRRGSSVVLDGVARSPYVEQCREVANQEGARFLAVLTECTDLDVHRIRIESRQRLIPDWYELDWEQVQRSRSTWDPLLPVDLTLQATDPTEANDHMLARLVLGNSG
jgi:predicted kinase